MSGSSYESARRGGRMHSGGDGACSLASPWIMSSSVSTALQPLSLAMLEIFPFSLMVNLTAPKCTRAEGSNGGIAGCGIEREPWMLTSRARTTAKFSLIQFHQTDLQSLVSATAFSLASIVHEGAHVPREGVKSRNPLQVTALLH